MPSSHPAPPQCHWLSVPASVLGPRSGPRLAWLLVGAILARGRRTVTGWIRAAGLSREYRPCYTTVAAAGKRADSIAARLLYGVVSPWDDIARRPSHADTRTSAGSSTGT